MNYQNIDLLKIFNGSKEGILVLQENKVILLNKTAKKICGFLENEIINKSFLNFVHKDDRKLVSKTYKDRMKGKKVPNLYKFRLVKKNKEIVWIQPSVSKINWNKKPASLVFVRVITESKLIEDKLKKNEKKYRKIFENTNTMIQSVNDQGRIVDVNQSWLDKLGYSKKEALKLNIMDIIAPESKKHCMKLFKKVISGKEIKNIEAVFLTKKGKKLFVQGTSNIIETNGDNPLTLGMFLDITTNKEIQNELIKNEEMYRSIFNSANDVIVLISKKGVILQVNDKLKELTGHDPKILIRKNIKELSHILTKKSIAIIMANFIKRLAGFNVLPYEVEAIKKDGKKIPVEINATVLKINNEVIGDLAILRDLSYTKEANELRLKLQKEEEMQKIKLDFLKNVSHQLRQPLVPILGYSQILLDDNPTKNQKKYLNKIIKNCNNLKEISNKVLDIVLIETKKSDLKLKPTKFKSIIKRIIKEYKKSMSKDIKIILSSKFNGYVKCDKHYMIQGISDLLSSIIFNIKKGVINISLSKNHNYVITTIKVMKTLESLEYVNEGGLNLRFELAKKIISKHKGELITEFGKKRGVIIKILIPIK